MAAGVFAGDAGPLRPQHREHVRGERSAAAALSAAEGAVRRQRGRDGRLSGRAICFDRMAAASSDWRQVSQRMKAVPGVRDVLSLAEVNALLGATGKGQKTGRAAGFVRARRIRWKGPAILNPNESAGRRGSASCSRATRIRPMARRRRSCACWNRIRVGCVRATDELAGGTIAEAGRNRHAICRTACAGVLAGRAGDGRVRVFAAGRGRRSGWGPGRRCCWA